MNARIKRIVFAILCLGIVGRLLSPLQFSVILSVAPGPTIAVVSLWQALITGLGVSYAGSFLFNYTDFARYTWPCRPFLIFVARRSATAKALVERGRARTISRALLARSAITLGAVLGVLALLALLYDSAPALSTALIATPLSAMSFLCGTLIGALTDILLPRSSLKTARVAKIESIPTARYPIRWNDSTLPLGDPTLSYAVIIPCHNYGEYLRDAIESVLSQTSPASEIVVVLDGCTDNSAQIAAEFAGRGVQSITVNCHDPYLARRAGFYATKAPLVCCLDADDYVNDSYFAIGTRCFIDANVGIATGWVQNFGALHTSWEPLPCDIQKLNCATSASIFRRVAALGIRAFERMEWAGVFEDDYPVWKGIARAGWQVALFEGTHFHRRHSRNKSITTPSDKEWAISLRNAHGSPTRKIRVGYVASVLLPAGGVETLLSQLLRYGFRIEWVGVAHAPKKPEDLIKDDTYMGIPIIKSHVFDDAVRKLASRSDVLYAWQADDLARLATLDLDIPVWGCVHGQCSYAATAGERIASIRAGHMVAVSEAASKVCLSPARIIYNGADLNALSQGPSRWEQRDMWGIGNDEIAVGYVGRWATGKRVNLIVSAFAHLPTHIRPVLCVAGALPPLDERRQAEESAGRKIVWTTTTTPGAAYRAFDAVVMASETEGGPLVALEAWACECPLITTPVGMIPELIQSHGDLAYLLPMNPSSQEIAMAIVRTLEDKSLTIERRERAKNMVWTHFTVWRTVRAWERGLLEVVKSATQETGVDEASRSLKDKKNKLFFELLQRSR